MSDLVVRDSMKQYGLPPDYSTLRFGHIELRLVQIDVLQDFEECSITCEYSAGTMLPYDVELTFKAIAFTSAQALQQLKDILDNFKQGKQ